MAWLPVAAADSDKQIGRKEGEQGRFLLHDLIHALQVMGAFPSLTC